jgi:hypothetical protein
MDLKRGGDLAVGQRNYFGQLCEQNAFGNLIVAVITSSSMAV